jgi:lysophospholipase L1-like esterase
VNTCMLPRNLTWLLLLCLLPAGCGDPVPQLPELTQDAVILAFGDSITAGTGAGREHAYPAQLERLTGRTVINAGVPGELSSAGLQRLPALLDRHQPQLLILCHAGNDILRNRDRGQAAGNLRTMVDHARQRGIAVLLLGVPEPGSAAARGSILSRGCPGFRRAAAKRRTDRDSGQQPLQVGPCPSQCRRL